MRIPSLRPPGAISDRELLYLVCACIAATQMSWSMVLPVLPLYAQSFSASALELGVAVAAFNVARILVNIPAGWIYQRVDRRLLLLSSVFGVAITLAATSTASNMLSLIGWRFVMGLFGGVVITAGQTLLADLSEMETRGATLATAQAFQLAGSSLGPVLGGVIAGTLGLRSAYVASALAVLVVAAWTAIRLPRFGPRSGVRGGSSPLAAFGLLGDRNFRAACFIGATTFFNRFGGRHTLAPLIAYTIAGVSVAALGAALSLITILNLATVRWTGRLSDRHGRKAVIVPSLLVSGSAYLFYILADNPTVFVITLVFIGVVNGFSGPTPAAYCADVAPRERIGEAIGVYRTSGDIAGLIAPVLIGALTDWFSFDVTIVFMAVSTCVAAIVFSRTAEETTGPRATFRPSAAP